MLMEIELSTELIHELKEFTQQKEPEMAVQEAMDSYIRYAKRMRLIDLSGKVEMANNWQELEDAEMKEIQDGSGNGAD
jgi:hypothetical protein